MATKSNLPINEIGLATPQLYSRIRTTIETAFYGNNVVKITSIAQAYELAKNSLGTVVTDQKVLKAKELGLPEDARVLLYNDGNITGRQAALRKLVDDKNPDQYSSVVREIVFATRHKKMYHAEVYIGLDTDFMVKAHLLVPEGYENTMYSWLMNFQIVNDEWTKVYEKSKKYDDGDIFIFADPDLYPAEFKDGLALFDEKHNCAVILGMRYFGEFKKGTLTLAWSMAARHGYTACHGGQKRFNLEGGKSKVISVFGLSGSGKSTITLSDHNGKFSTTVLHDDAFIISNKDASSVCLENSYFDKTQDYPLTKEQSKYFVTVQNCGATVDEDGKIVLVTEDIRCGNGRTVKSKFATANREYKFANPTNAIFWIMKDATLPPVVKVNDPALASAMGATLATKRSSAEFIKNLDVNKLVISPYANPFRLYPLAEDYKKFKSLFADLGIDCYIINTGSFLDKKVTKEVTLGLIEDIVADKATFVPFGPCKELQYMPIPGYEVHFENPAYSADVKARLMDRVDYVKDADEHERLPEEALEALRNVAAEIE